MKLGHLLTEYLYIHKRLDLPGIGSFTLDPSSYVDAENSKHGRSANLAGVNFENNPALKESPDLVLFISKQAGKMKALAASDLDSYLELAQQFLNIGKPFLFEGIGSLVKTKSGQLVFTSGQIMPEKMKEYSVREISATSSTEDSFTNYKNIFSKEKSGPGLRRPLVVGLIIIGILFAIWAGYTVYKTTTGNKQESLTKDETTIVEDSALTNTLNTQPVQMGDSSSSLANDSVKTLDGSLRNYKIVLEVANQRRAAERFAKLKAYQWKVQIETRDSVAYKLFVVVPALAADTTRILDSLYSLNGKRVYIEH